jgi:hypothetical protein
LCICISNPMAFQISTISRKINKIFSLFWLHFCELFCA